MSTTQKIKSPKLTMTPVKSSQVKSHGYDPVSRTLAVEFNSGGVYHYIDVPADVYAKMQKSESVGSFLGKHIKPAFKFKKIEV